MDGLESRGKRKSDRYEKMDSGIIGRNHGVFTGGMLWKQQ